MKRIIAKTTLAILLFVTLHLCLAPSARAQDEGVCSNAAVAGKWGFTTNGTVVGVGPRASLGQLTLDATGNVRNGTPTASLNGTSRTAEGSWSPLSCSHDAAMISKKTH